MTATTTPDAAAPAKTSDVRLSLFQRLLRYLSWGLLVATWLGACGDWNWRLDLFAHFRWYYFVFAVLGLILAGLQPNKWARCVLLVAGIWNGALLIPYYAPGSQAAISASATPLSLISLNVYTANPNKAGVVDYLKRADADIVFAMEIDRAWAGALESLRETYPHRVSLPRQDNFGVMMLSKRPFVDSKFGMFGGAEVPSIVVTMEHQGRTLQLIGTHPLPPVGERYSSLRNKQLEELGDFVRESTLPTIVIGDLNATPWSSGFRLLTSRSGLRDSALGRGVSGTWNAKLPIRIPIDHALIPAGIGVIRRQIGPDVGSDHFPLEVTLAIPEK